MMHWRTQPNNSIFLKMVTPAPYESIAAAANQDIGRTWETAVQGFASVEPSATRYDDERDLQ